MTKLQIKLLSENATMPKRANETDAGYDIYAAETVILEPQEKAIIKTDLAVNIPKGYVGLLTSRSGVSSKTHLVIETDHELVSLVIRRFFQAEDGIRDIHRIFSIATMNMNIDKTW